MNSSGRSRHGMGKGKGKVLSSSQRQGLGGLGLGMKGAKRHRSVGYILFIFHVDPRDTKYWGEHVAVDASDCARQCRQTLVVGAFELSPR